MKVLFIGGSGIISTASTALAVERGLDIWLLNRGRSAVPSGVKSLTADLGEAEAVRAALEGHEWDAVVQWIAFNPAAVERDIGLFRGRTKQYVFISSASAYQKPAEHYVITEKTPLVNPYWEYSRQKIACEERLMQAHGEEGFPVTIVRPSLTYGDTQVPLVMNSWAKSWTAVERIRQGEPVIVPGDGNSLWTVTHNSDFALGLVGLLGKDAAIGEAFHITSDEVLTWNDIFLQTARAAGVESPRLVHIASDFLTACLPDSVGTLYGDKAVSSVFDNSKIRSVVPDFRPRVCYAEGIKRTIAWFEADAARQQIDTEASAMWDKLIGAYEEGLARARERFAR